MTRMTRSYVAPNHLEFDYWVDLTSDPKGNVIKYYAGGSKWLPINDDTNNDQSLKIQQLENNKVDKVANKQLSTNDFTNALKSKLDDLTKVTVDNNLTSTSAVNALSAAQGKLLKDLIDSLITRVEALETPIV